MKLASVEKRLEETLCGAVPQGVLP